MSTRSVIRLDFRPCPRRTWALARGERGSAHVCGWAEVQGRRLEARELAALLLDGLSGGMAPVDMFRGWQGNWASCWEIGGMVGLGVDHIRSIPLAYRSDDGVVAVSDEIGPLLHGQEAVDPDSALEFAAAGYVTGPHTLYGDIFGVQAGEVVLIGADHVPEQQEWFAHRCVHEFDGPAQEFCPDHARRVAQAVARCLAGLEDRQILVPLSGGLDSRLVAQALARAGRTDALCFTYGLEGSFEAREAREAAARMGLSWEPVAYRERDVRHAVNSREYEEYGDFAWAGISCPHPDDFLAVKLLQERGLARPGAVFFPGHTGDFLCGGHLKYLFDPREHADPLDFDPAMVSKHYGLWDRLARDGRALEVFSNRLASAVGGMDRSTEQGAAAAYEFWEWRERQAKFIVNAVRVYEFFGYGWRVPLWDRDLTALWQRPSIGNKLGGHLYRACLEADDPLGVFQGVSRPRFDREAAAREGRTPVLPLGYLARVRKHDRVWRRHPSGLARAVPRLAYALAHPGKRHVLSLLAARHLERTTGVRVRDLPARG